MNCLETPNTTQDRAKTLLQTPPNMRPAAIILTHRRAKTFTTRKLLLDLGWPWLIYLLVEQRDPDLPEYKRLYGDEVLIYDREQVEVDYFDNNGPTSVAVHARNATNDWCRKLGITHQLQCDDDLYGCHLATELNNDLRWLYHWRVSRLPEWCQHYLFPYVCLQLWQLIDRVPFMRAACIGMSSDCAGKVYLTRRKVMQAILISQRKPITFSARFNEDVTTYVTLNSLGEVTPEFDLIVQQSKPTQVRSGGMSNEYKQVGTYIKTFYTVLRWPESITIADLGLVWRIHHFIRPHIYPKIVPPTVRKPD